MRFFRWNKGNIYNIIVISLKYCVLLTYNVWENWGLFVSANVHHLVSVISIDKYKATSSNIMGMPAMMLVGGQTALADSFILGH